MVIYKYNLARFVEQTVAMPSGAKVLCAQMQDGQITIWALVDPNALLVDRIFKVIGTGWPLTSNPGEYIGTVQNDSLVWHVFSRQG